MLALMLLAYFGMGTYRHLPYKIEGDGKYYYQYLVSGFYDHDFDFSNNYRQTPYPWMATELDNYQLRNEVSPVTHLPKNIFSTGPALLWLPTFLLTYLLAHLLHLVGFDVDLNPWGQFFQYGVMLASVLYGWLTLRLLYQLLRRYFDEKISLWTLLLFTFLTPFFYYAVVESSMSHVYDLFAYALLISLILKSRETSYVQWLPSVGAAAALCVLARTQNVPTIMIIGAWLFVDYGLITRRWVSLKLLIALLTFIVCLLPLPLMNLYLFGDIWIVPQGAGFMQWANPQLISLLFSWKNGFFSYHPVLLGALVGFGIWLAKPPSDTVGQRWFWVVVLLGFVGQVYVNACVLDWWSGHSFGQRRLISSYPLFVLGLGWVLNYLKTYWRPVFSRWITPISVLLCGMWVYLMLIHIFIWNYEEPHNIFVWMFYTAPTKLLAYFWG